MAPNSLVLAARQRGAAWCGGGHERQSNTRRVALISGVVPCSTGSSINVASVQAFPNAGVQLLSGVNIWANAMAESSGAFAISLGVVSNPIMLNALHGNQCKVDVTTPLAACNVSLAGATGTLEAPLRLLGASTGDLVGTIAGIAVTIVGGVLSFVSGSFSV